MNVRQMIIELSAIDDQELEVFTYDVEDGSRYSIQMVDILSDAIDLNFSTKD